MKTLGSIKSTTIPKKSKVKVGNNGKNKYGSRPKLDGRDEVNSSKIDGGKVGNHKGIKVKNHQITFKS